MLIKRILLFLCIIVGFFYVNIEQIEAGKCVTDCNQHYGWPTDDSHCVVAQSRYVSSATNMVGACFIGGTGERDMSTIIFNSDCSSSVNNRSCKAGSCPTSGDGVYDQATCHLYFTVNGTSNSACESNETHVQGKWSTADNACIQCSGGIGYIWGDATQINPVPSAICRTFCGADAACDGKSIGSSCGGTNTCDSSCSCTSSGPSCSTACDNTCDDLACAGIDPDCPDGDFSAAACAACASDPDCTITDKYICNESDNTAENCNNSVKIDCDSIDGTSCDGGTKTWECNGCSSSGCANPSFPAATCGGGGECEHGEMQACDCDCSGPAPSGPSLPVCGDGDCEGTEASTCPQDCSGPGYSCPGDCKYALSSSDIGCTCGSYTTVSGDEYKYCCAADSNVYADFPDCDTNSSCGSGGGSSTSSLCATNNGILCNVLGGTIDSLFEGGEITIQAILGLLGTIALLFFIIAGIMYMTAAGEEEKINSAKRIFTGTIMGLGIALIAFSLLQVIVDILG